MTLIALILFLLSSTSLGAESFATDENRYVKTCGACMPLEADPTRWTKQCVIRNSDESPLLYYTMEETCGTCSYVGNNQMVCDTPAGKQTHRVGMSFCP